MKNNTIKFSNLVFLFLLSGFCFSVNAAPTEVVATVDRNPVMMEESFTLTITANDDVPTDAFDSSPLLRDYVVGRTSVNRQTQMINFNTTRSTVWNTTLFPRQPGQFTIPAMTVAGIQTKPINLSVVQVSPANNSQHREIFLTSEIENDEVYVQQQIKYKVRLHLALDVQSGNITPPTVPNAEVTKVGDDKEYTDIINGKRYRIVERIFSIIPNSSGDFTIGGSMFDGEVIDNSRQSFGFFNRTRNVQRLSKDLDIKVLPIPESYNDHWLPSEFVQITEEWQTPDDQFRVGVPATRIISLTAVGVAETQLPEINSLYPKNVKVYPDQANTTQVQRNGTIVSQRTETIALIPNEEGNVIIPEVSVQWFNVLKKKMEKAVLPSRTLNILPPEVSAEELPQIPQTTINQQTPVQQQTGTSPLNVIPTPTWWSLTSWLLLALWLITLLLWWLTYQRKPQVITNSNNAIKTTDSDTTPWQDLQKELMRKQPDVGKIQNLLPLWLVTITGKPYTSLGTQLDLMDDTEIRLLINELFKGQYGKKSNHTGDISGTSQLIKQLLKVSQQIEKQQRNKRKQEDITLRPLYPTA